MIFYSFKGQEPAELPNRIRLSNGLTRTSKETFTEEEIADAGYIQAEPKPESGFTEYQKVLWNGSVWEIVDLTEEEKQIKIAIGWQLVREKRNQKLSSTDWMYLRSIEQGQTVPYLLKYRQDLRDITKQTDPYNIEWPTIEQPSNTQPTVGN